jgi:hypothetical protein
LPWFRGNKWPPNDVLDSPLKWVDFGAASTFPRRYWTSFHYSIAVLGEFVSVTNAAGTLWKSFKTTLNGYLPTTQAAKEDELKELIELIEYRSGVMAEALAQRANLIAYWRGVLMCRRASHPYTYDLLEIALRVGQFQAIHYKREFSRPRPSQLSPALMPPIDVPGHASFPSGHATEAYLMAKCLEKVMPDVAKEPAVTGDPTTTPLHRVAQRIARNREVLGLHYKSDSAAGLKLAELTLPVLGQCTLFNEIVTEAAKEWQSPLY